MVDALESAERVGAVMASLHTLEQRVRALEARLTEVEGGYGETSYRLRRDSVRTNLNVAKLMVHMQLTPTTDAEVDAALDEEDLT